MIARGSNIYNTCIISSTKSIAFEKKRVKLLIPTVQRKNALNLTITLKFYTTYNTNINKNEVLLMLWYKKNC
jgi:hypothetical protein